MKSQARLIPAVVAAMVDHDIGVVVHFKDPYRDEGYSGNDGQALIQSRIGLGLTECCGGVLTQKACVHNDDLCELEEGDAALVLVSHIIAPLSEAQREDKESVYMHLQRKDWPGKSFGRSFDEPYVDNQDEEGDGYNSLGQEDWDLTTEDGAGLENPDHLSPYGTISGLNSPDNGAGIDQTDNEFIPEADLTLPIMDNIPAFATIISGVVTRRCPCVGEGCHWFQAAHRALKGRTFDEALLEPRNKAPGVDFQWLQNRKH